MKEASQDDIPEDVRSTLARMDHSEKKNEAYGLWSRVLMFVVIAALCTAFFGYWFVKYSIGMGMTAGTGSDADRNFGWLLVFGYPAVLLIAAFGIFKR